MLGIYKDPNSPHVMLETYTLHINYPSSKQHQIMAASHSQVDMILSISNYQDVQKDIQISTRDSFRYQLARLVKSVCMISQKLDPLPSTLISTVVTDRFLQKTVS